MVLGPLTAICILFNYLITLEHTNFLKIKTTVTLMI